MSKSSSARQIIIKNEPELDLIRLSCNIAAKALKKALGTIQEGVSLKQVEWAAEEEIKRLGGESAFKKVPGYYYSTCISVNDGVVHGIPKDYILQKGDIVSVDLGVLYQGWNSDLAWSVQVGGGSSRFLETGEKALWSAVDQVKEGNRIGDISHAIQKTIEGSGYSVVESLIGHGFGKSLHEAPEIPGRGRPGTGPVLKKGMTLAIEVIYTEGGPEVQTGSDGWTVVTKDHSLGGLFEIDVIVQKDHGEIAADWRSVN